MTKTRYNVDKDSKEAKSWLASKGYDRGTHARFSVGEFVHFENGQGVPMEGTIKGINGDDIYIYSDCYWFPLRSSRLTKTTNQPN